MERSTNLGFSKEREKYLREKKKRKTRKTKKTETNPLKKIKSFIS
jgi:hypothetical protein